MSKKIVANIKQKKQISEGLHVIQQQTPEERGIPVKKKVAAYCRVSTDLEVQQSSIETQMASYRQLILEHPNWELAGIYADQESATEATNRKEFLRMIADAKAGKIDLILAKSTSRFARNTVDALNYVRELKERGIGVYFEKEKINTGSPTFNSELIFTVYAAFAQEESRSLSENMKRGIRQRFHMGIPKWTDLYGYERTGKDEWSVVEEEAKTVRKIFKMYNEGVSLGEIANYLNEKGIPSPSKQHSDASWHGKTVSDILKNEKYTGDCLMQKYFTADHLSHRQVRNNSAKVPQYYKENHHEGIVSKRDFERAHKIMILNTVNNGNAMYPYYGYLLCPHCGKPMVRTGIGTRVHCTAWICGGDGNKVRWEDRTSCPVYWVKEEYVNKAVMEAFKNLNPEDYSGWKKTDIEWVQGHVSKTGKVDLLCLEKLVKSITFPDWNTMQITWKFAGKTEIPVSYENPSDYPELDIREEGGKTFFGNLEVSVNGKYGAKMAAENNERKVRLTCIYPDETGTRMGIPIVRSGGKK